MGAPARCASSSLSFSSNSDSCIIISILRSVWSSLSEEESLSLSEVSLLSSPSPRVPKFQHLSESV